MRRPLIAGNWKMNGFRHVGVELAQRLRRRMEAETERPFELLLCPPATLLWPIAEAIRGSGILLGAQDCSAEPQGAHTGDISADMLADAGCTHVILGHSERRREHGEGDPLVRAKAKAAQAAGLVTIVCVGETEEVRDRGETIAVVASQLRGSVPSEGSAATTVVAYEPVWAIGTGKTPTAEEIDEVHGKLRRELRAHWKDGDRVRILYGGSVNPGNAREILSLPGVDGALVGGASLIADDLWTIASSCGWRELGKPGTSSPAKGRRGGKVRGRQGEGPIGER